MDVFGKFAEYVLRDNIVRDIIGWFDWAVGHWSITMIVLAVLVYWAGRQRRLDRRHL